MERKQELEWEILNARDILDKKIVKDIDKGYRNNLDTLQISVALDKLIIDYIIEERK